MSPATPKPPKPWQRAEAGRYRSADDRFMLASEGGGRWFITDAASLDELGLGRTTGPYATLDAAKAAADEAREGPAAASPLADRLAEVKAWPAAAGPAAAATSGAARPRAGSTPRQASGAAARREPEPVVESLAPPRTWLDELEGTDPAAAKQARKLVRALEDEGIADAEALVRRDVLGGRPAVATRLLARDVVAAIAGLRDPTAARVAEAVAVVIESSPARAGLPGWELLERAGPRGDARGRPIRLTADALRAAAGLPRDG